MWWWLKHGVCAGRARNGLSGVPVSEPTGAPSAPLQGAVDREPDGAGPGAVPAP